MEIYEKNIKILEQKYPKIAKAVIEDIKNENYENVKVIEIDNGEKVICVSTEKWNWYLNSRLNPIQAAEIYAERYKVRVYQIYFVFGFGDGRHIRALLQNCDKTNKIIILEPNRYIYAKAVEQFDIQDILSDDRVLLCVPQISEDLARLMGAVVGYSNMKLIEFCILPGYDVLYTEECEKMIDDVIDAVETEVMHESTYLSFSRMIPQNMLFNMKHMITQCNHEQLRQQLREIDLSKIPAIIVSAGPSLDKNVQELKKAQGKAFIVVVDAALRTVLRAGVRPDMICSVDPEVPDRFFENLDLSGLAWSCDRQTRPWILQNFGEHVFYYGWFTKHWGDTLSEELGYPFPSIDSGGSVTSEAFQLVRFLGFKKIILVGQDLAFTNGISHTSGIDGAFGDNDEYIESRFPMQVDGIDGTRLDTDYQMWRYKRWFEKAIKQYHDEIEVINATEGGARIEGVVNRRLDETICRECRMEADIFDRIKQILPAFNIQQQKKLLHEYNDLEDKALQFQKSLDESICTLKKMLTRSKIEQQDINLQKKMLKWILQENECIAEHPMMEWIILYAQKEEHELKESIYMDENTNVDELIEKTLKLYQGYHDAIYTFIEDIKDVQECKL